MTRMFKSLIPKPARKNVAPASGRKPARPVDRAKLDQAATARQADHGQQASAGQSPEKQPEKPKEIGGPQGPEPTRYGDWERGGICYDF